MKTLLILFLLVTSYLSYSQEDNGELNPTRGGEKTIRMKTDLYLIIKDTQGNPVSFLDVSLKDKESDLVLKGTTDKAGKLSLVVIKGIIYQIFMEEIHFAGEVNIPLKTAMFVTKNITYQSSHLQGVIPMDTVFQYDIDDTQTFDATLVKINVVNKTNRLMNRLPVRLVCKEINKVYVTRTKSDGTATFRVPRGKKFKLGVGDVDDYLDVETREGSAVVGKGVRYESPIKITETIKNDTIRQTLLADNVYATSSQAFIKTYISNLSGSPLSDEDVCLNIEGTNKVYFVKTNAMGEAMFLIPYGKKYTLHFKYDRNVDLIDLIKTPAYTLHTTEIEYSYRGSAAIEAFYKTTKRDKKGFITDFETSTVSPLKIHEDYLEKTNLGYNINMKTENAITTPSISNNKILMSAFYSAGLFCFDAITGKYSWGAQLAESGISTAVSDNNYILVTTESCTLYVLDAVAGTMLWSKWLSPYLFTTPTVANGYVYAVYGNDLNSYTTSKAVGKFVLACFELKSGKIKWQNWINGEGLASPVVADGNVYLTTLAGTLYMFGDTSGIEIAKKDIKAVSAPTVVDNKLYISTLSKDSKIETVQILDASNLNPILTATALSEQYLTKDLQSSYACLDMLYTGSRLIHYKGKNFNIMNSKLICSDPNSGSILWSDDLSLEQPDKTKPVSGMPIIAGEKLLVSTQTGKIILYNPNDGKKTATFETGETLWNQPICYKGWVYSTSTNGKMVSVNTKNPNITGWGAWNMNAAHNPVIK